METCRQFFRACRPIPHIHAICIRSASKVFGKFTFSLSFVWQDINIDLRFGDHFHLNRSRGEIVDLHHNVNHGTGNHIRESDTQIATPFKRQGTFEIIIGIYSCFVIASEIYIRKIGISNLETASRQGLSILEAPQSINAVTFENHVVNSIAASGLRPIFPIKTQFYSIVVFRVINPFVGFALEQYGLRIQIKGNLAYGPLGIQRHGKIPAIIGNGFRFAQCYIGIVRSCGTIVMCTPICIRQFKLIDNLLRIFAPIPHIYSSIFGKPLPDFRHCFRIGRQIIIQPIIHSTSQVNIRIRAIQVLRIGTEHC